MAKKSGKKEVDSEISKEKLLEESKRKSEFLLNKASTSEIEVYDLVKYFFKKFLKKEHELTCEELESELGNVYLEEDIKDDFKKFLHEIYLMEYSNKAFTQDELNLLVSEFQNIIERLLVPVVPKKKIFSLFKKKKKHEEFEEFEEKLKELEEAEKQQAAHSPEERIEITIEKVNLLLKQKKMKTAKEAYQSLVCDYELSHKDIQKKYYNEITELFKQLQI